MPSQENGLFIGNFKANSVEAKEWLRAFRSVLPEVPQEAQVVVCPSYPELSDWRKAIVTAGLPILLGSQDLSLFPPGAYTGEVPAIMLKRYNVTAVIIGHSERRSKLGETDEQLAQKAVRALEAGFRVIYCVADTSVRVPSGVSVVAYEPPGSIGSGKPDTPENADEVIRLIKKQTGVQVGLYGGSVKPDNVAAFLREPAIDGVLVGGASLTGDSFASIVKNGS